MAAPDPDLVFCVTQTIVILSEHRRIVRPIRGPAPGRSFAEFLYNDGGFAQSSSFFLAKSLAQRFPFREDLRQMVDHLFFMELGAAGASYLLVPEPLTVWHNEERPGSAWATILRSGARSFSSSRRKPGGSSLPTCFLQARLGSLAAIFGRYRRLSRSSLFGAPIAEAR